MKLLKEISEKTLNISTKEILGETYKLRKSARGIIFNNVGEIAVQYLTNRNYHKLPGGGVEVGETCTEALEREILEEVGFNIDTPTELGAIIEYRNFEKLLHISYGYSANATEKVTEPQLEQREIEEGQETIWVTPEKALLLMKNDTPNEKQGYFILAREISFIEEYSKIKS